MKGCRPLTTDEVRRIYEALGDNRWGPRDQAFFAVGISTGFRFTEVVTLKVGDVYANKAVMGHIRRPARIMKGKKRGRAVRVHPRCRAALRVWINQMIEIWGEPDKRYLHPKMYLFQSQEGSNRHLSYNRARSMIKDAAQRAGIYEAPGLIGTHIMRKTYANRVYEYFEREYLEGRSSTNPLVATQEALGHTSIAATQSYLSFRFSDVPESFVDVF